MEIERYLHYPFQYLCRLHSPVMNEIRLVYLLLCIPTWLLFGVGSLKFLVLLWQVGRDGDDKGFYYYCALCCITSCFTGCVCLCLSCMSEKTWQNHTATGIIGVVNLGLLGHCLHTTWATGSWNSGDEGNEVFDIHRIGDMYVRLEFVRAYNLMLLGGFSCSLFWGVSQVMKPHFQPSKPSQVTAISSALPVIYVVVFVIIFTLICKSHNEVMEYVPVWAPWLRGGCLVAAVLYTSMALYLALDWQGPKYIATCGVTVTVCGVSFLVLKGISEETSISLDMNELQYFSLLLITVSSVVYLLLVSFQSLGSFSPSKEFYT